MLLNLFLHHSNMDISTWREATLQPPSWQLMAWWHKEPGHQEPCTALTTNHYSLLYTDAYNTQCATPEEIWKCNQIERLKKKIRCSSDKNQTRVVVGKTIKLSGQVKLGNNNLIGPLTLAMAMAQGCYGITRGPLQYYDYEKYLVNSDWETMS